MTKFLKEPLAVMKALFGFGEKKTQKEIDRERSRSMKKAQREVRCDRHAPLRHARVCVPYHVALLLLTRTPASSTSSPPLPPPFPRHRRTPVSLAHHSSIAKSARSSARKQSAKRRSKSMLKPGRWGRRRRWQNRWCRCVVRSSSSSRWEQT